MNPERNSATASRKGLHRLTPLLCLLVELVNVFHAGFHIFPSVTAAAHWAQTNCISVMQRGSPECSNARMTSYRGKRHSLLAAASDARLNSERTMPLWFPEKPSLRARAPSQARDVR